MRNIIRLIQKYINFILFLILQVISFIFIFNWRNNYHHSSYLSSSNYIIGSVYDFKSAVTDYFLLEDINDQLKKENEGLKEDIFNQEIILGETFNIADYEHQYDFSSSKVINSKFKSRLNYMTINIGEESGVKPNMGVIGTKGILGYTISCSPYYSIVLPIINPLFELNVIHSKTKAWGMLKWTEKNENWLTAIVDDVSATHNIKIGDFFETSGSAGIFPKGIIAGKVVSIERSSDPQYQIVYISLAEDYSKVHCAYVIKNNLQLELNNIQSIERD